jgi:hypothetical protein
MAEEPDYISLSKRFDSLAARTSDPLLATSYRKLAQTYRALDFWHERFRDRYEATADGKLPPDAEKPEHDQQ